MCHTSADPKEQPEGPVRPPVSCQDCPLVWGCCGLCQRAFSDRWRLGPGHSVLPGTLASCQSGRHLAVLPAHLSPGHFPNFCRHQQLHPATPTTPMCTRHTTHTHTCIQHTRVHAHGLSAAWPPGSEILKLVLSDPWLPRGGQGIGAEYWSRGQALGRGVALGSDPAAVPRFGLAASLHIYLETFQLTAGLPIILHNLCLLRRQKWGCL